MPIVSTTCPMDCPDCCALEVTVEDGAVTAIGGAADHPTTRGFLCSKVSRFHRRLDHPDRLLRPLRRVGAKGEGSFEPISWDDAVGEISERFRAIRASHGGEAILPYHYGGSNGLLSEELVDDLYFARLGASRLAKTLCATPSGAVAKQMYGKMPGVAHEDFPAAKAIVVWGANPKASQIHLVPFLKQARDAGAFVAVVDPQRNFSDREVDLHLAVRPGTDLPVALALIERWRREGRFDDAFLEAHAVGLEPLLQRAAEWSLERAAAEAGVAAADLARLADAYADASPALLRTGWGMERNSNGGQAIAALLAMPALLGKFGVRGGGYTMSNSGAARFDEESVLGPLDWHTRVLNMTRLGALLDPTATVDGNGGPPLAPPVKALFVYNANPVATTPDQRAVLAGLARDDLFTVVFDQVMTDTAVWADVVLPAATFLEQWEIKKSYGTYVIGGIRPAVARCGEARPNVEVFAALGRAMGFDDEPFGWDEETAFRKVAAALTYAGRPVDVERLAAGLWVQPDFPGTTPVQFDTVHPATADGKIHLSPDCLGAAPYAYRPVGDRSFPLALITPGSHRMITSTMGEYNLHRLTVTLHPEDAEARGIEGGDEVRVWNGGGEVVCPAVVSDSVRPGVALMPKGAWRRSSGNGATSTALTPATVDNVGGGACFNDARVEVTRVAVATDADEETRMAMVAGAMGAEAATGTPVGLSRTAGAAAATTGAATPPGDG